jgi:hypothetical protein
MSQAKPILSLLVFAGALLGASGVHAAKHPAVAAIATLHDVQVDGGHGYGGADSYDQGGPSGKYEAIGIRDARVGDHQLEQLSALTDLPVKRGATKYLGHPYSRVSARCKAVRIYRMHGKLYGQGEHCTISEAAR